MLCLIKFTCEHNAKKISFCGSIGLILVNATMQLLPTYNSSQNTLFPVTLVNSDINKLIWQIGLLRVIDTF